MRRIAKYVLVMLGVFLAGLIVGCGCHVNNSLEAMYPQNGRAKVDMVVMAESLSYGKDLWAAEIQRKYPGAVALLCHGGDNGQGVWTLYPDVMQQNGWVFPIPVELPTVPVETEVYKLKAEYPGRLIVLCVCNAHHHRLNIPGVVYALDEVYVIPDRVNLRSQPNTTGNIYEFVHD